LYKQDDQKENTENNQNGYQRDTENAPDDLFQFLADGHIVLLAFPG
jgi:hypothetical protein